jgi:hypothetical protein
MSQNRYECSECGKELTADRNPCSSCGSTRRNVYVTASTGIKFRDRIKAVLKNSSGKKKKIIYSGEKLSKHGKEAKEELVIDIEGDRKFHHVEELDEKGNWVVVHHCDEKLKEKKGENIAQMKLV